MKARQYQQFFLLHDKPIVPYCYSTPIWEMPKSRILCGSDQVLYENQFPFNSKPMRVNVEFDVLTAGRDSQGAGMETPTALTWEFWMVLQSHDIPRCPSLPFNNTKLTSWSLLIRIYFWVRLDAPKCCRCTSTLVCPSRYTNVKYDKPLWCGKKLPTSINVRELYFTEIQKPLL